MTRGFDQAQRAYDAQEAPGCYDADLPQEKCSMCGNWTDAEDQHEDGEPIYPTCPTCDDVTCAECKDDDTEECSACVQRAEAKRHNAVTTFAALSQMSRMVAEGGAPFRAHIAQEQQ